MIRSTAFKAAMFALWIASLSQPCRAAPYPGVTRADVPSAAGLHLVEGDAWVTRITYAHATTTALSSDTNAISERTLALTAGYARKATPSYTWSLDAETQRRGNAAVDVLMPAYAYKILDRLILGLGIGAERAATRAAARIAPAVAIKGEGLSFGYAADFRREGPDLQRTWLVHGSYDADASDTFAAVYRRTPLHFDDQQVFDFKMRRRFSSFAAATQLGYRARTDTKPQRTALGIETQHSIQNVPVSAHAVYEFGADAAQRYRKTTLTLGMDYSCR